MAAAGSDQGSSIGKSRRRSGNGPSTNGSGRRRRSRMRQGRSDQSEGRALPKVRHAAAPRQSWVPNVSQMPVEARRSFSDCGPSGSSCSDCGPSGSSSTTSGGTTGRREQQRKSSRAQSQRGSSSSRRITSAVAARTQQPAREAPRYLTEHALQTQLADAVGGDRHSEKTNAGRLSQRSTSDAELFLNCCDHSDGVARTVWRMPPVS